MDLRLPDAAEESAPTIEDYMVARDALRELAADDVNAFVEYVLRDEETGAPISQAPMHEAWHELADEHPRLIVWSHVEAGKTSQISIGRVLWLLGRDPTLRIGIVSNTAGQAKKIVGAIKQYIERSTELHEVFPALRPGRYDEDKWTDTAITVDRPFVSKDPSLQAFGYHGAVLSARLDLIVLDDFLDIEVTASADQRKKLSKWTRSELFGRLTSRGRVLMIGNAYDRKDLMHELATDGAWHAVRYPVLDDRQFLADGSPNPLFGEPRWPGRWSRERVAATMKVLGTAEGNRQLKCVARTDEDRRFKSDYVDRCKLRGRNNVLVHHLTHVPPGFRTFTGVDLAAKDNETEARTVFFTIAEHPNGDREVLDVTAGKFSGPEIVRLAKEVHARYHSILVVENNGVQGWIREFVQDETALPIVPFLTGANKANPAFGVESLAVEMENSKWIIPSLGGVGAEVQLWIDEMLDYDPRAHTGDRLMASWFAREGVRRPEETVEVGTITWSRR